MTRCWHVTIATVSRETAFPTELARRAAVRKIVRIAGKSLLLFGVVDDHTHTVLRTDEAGAGRTAQRLNCSLASCGLRFAQADIRPVAGRLHLRRLVNYILTQPKHHDLLLHPALWEGSCLQDLVGARWLPGLELRIRDELPRLSLADLMNIVGLPSRAILPANRELLREAGLSRIAASTGATVAAGSLRGRRTEELEARRVAVRLAYGAGFTRREISEALGCPPRSVTRYAVSDVAPEAIRAARVRIALERAVEAAGRAAAHAVPDAPPLPFMVAEPLRAG